MKYISSDELEEFLDELDKQLSAEYKAENNSVYMTRYQMELVRKMIEEKIKADKAINKSYQDGEI